ncbi:MULTISPECIES: PAS domain S-box protein [unclassified Pseudomonas]|uniref:PAS domain S-box protein n=1 Tax=unclassified Pseudomonas TaxID=196821 RepID=UPI00244883C8|nr:MULTISPECIES: PAS domain S-box protein [unclassified Pseudomonas]MDG9927377.1 PAS domain S-box protein [Pseudomonas sp. GD04042]MDH0482446.1 PAS domain S-box protein [Pseudomonas sp. GD04015]MDH0602798.1 PAS domain S-box protein [Pseudomonas sp. GD03869]
MSYLTSLFLLDADPSLLLFGSHNPWLVALSLAIATFTSGMALQVAGMARLSRNTLHRQTALLTGSLALGGGVWAMHFIGMLAFQLCAPVSYAPGLTLLSLLPSLGASWVALQLLARRQVTRLQLVGSGVLVGAGIGAMHYSGMAAMRMAPLLRYDPWWFALSILVAVGLAILALWVRFGLRGRLSSGKAIMASGLVMGLAISGMHYTGMAAARFVGSPDPVGAEGDFSLFLALATALITISLTVFVAGINGLLRYRQLYRQMQASEERLRAILETAVDGVVTIDDQGIIESMNAAAAQLYGWDKSELIGRHIDTVIPQSYRQGMANYLPQLLNAGESQIIGGSREVELLRKDGTELPIRLAIGRAQLFERTLFVGFISDISERKAMEKALRESEQQYRSLIGNIPGVAFRCQLDENWSMLFISDAVEKLTGWPAEDFVAGRRHFTQLIHPDDQVRVGELARDALAEGRSYQVEYRLTRRDGSEVWVWESGSGAADEQGAPHWIDGVMLDITESKLRNAEFEGTVNAIGRALSVIEFDLGGRVLSANRNFLELTGYEEAEIIGQHHRIFCEQRYVDSGAYDQFWAHLAHGELDSGEYLCLGKGGREVWIQASYNPIFDADGKPFKVIQFATDLSQRREMEEALRIAKERAELAAAAKTTFLANMSHEIRTPMNAIIGFTELLLDDVLSEQQRRHLGTVRQAARSLLGLLNDILDTAKLERGAVELEHVDFSLRELCGQVCDALRLGAEGKGLTLSLDYQESLGDFFKGDPLRIQQVLTNLVGNAVKFTESGWVRLEVSGEPGRVQLSVRDSGIGIAEDRLQHIFDPFAQADASMSRRFGGTGLGTTIARQLTELMGGSIRVESRDGAGSVFHVQLPLQVGEARAGEIITTVCQLPELNILAADDVPQNIELLSLTLGAMGHRVTTAGDGEQALAAFVGGRFDVLLMDVQMPRMDGLEATRRIRRHEQAHGLRPTPVIALTASVLEQDRRAAREAGMDGFASKPLEMDRLLAEIARVIGLEPTATTQVPAAEPQQDLAIDWPRGIQLWGSEQAMAAAIRRFLAEHAHSCAEVEGLLRDGRQLEAIELVHRLRGAAGNLALLRASRLAGQLEHALKGAVPASVEELLAALVAALDALPSELPAEKTAVEEGARPAIAEAELSALVGQVRGALRHGELAEDALQRLSAALPARQAHALEGAINDFDFERADALLAELLGHGGMPQ